MEKRLIALNVYFGSLLADLITTTLNLQVGNIELNSLYPFPGIFMGIALGFGFWYAEKWLPRAYAVNLILACLVVILAVTNNLLILVNTI